MSLGLLQAGLGDHCLELIPGAHVDGLRNQLACTIRQIRPIDVGRLKALQQEQRQITAEPRTGT